MSRSRFDDWVHGTFPVSAEGLALYRIAYAAFAVLVMAPGHDVYANLLPFASLPDSMYAPPPGPMMLFGGFPSIAVAHTLHALVNFSLAALLVGYRTRLTSILTGVLLVVIYGFSYSLGKINHNIMFVAVPLAMAYSGWGAAFSYDAAYRVRRSVQSWPLTLLAVIVGFAMFTAGFAKILGGWLDPSTHATYGHALKHFFIRERTDLLARQAIELTGGPVWEILDYATVLLEVGFLAAVTRARHMRLFVGMAVLFHLGIMLVLNISFHFNLIAYAAFLNWAPAGTFVRRLRTEKLSTTRLFTSRQTARVVILAGGAIIGALGFAVGSPLLWIDELVPLQSDLLAREVLVMCIGTAVAAYLGIRGGLARLQRMKSRIHYPSTT